MLACEPFYQTLESWKEQTSQIDFEVAKEVLTQITRGLVFYHSNDIVHGNLTSKQIAIYSEKEKITAKIFMFPVNDGMNIGLPSAATRTGMRS